MVNKDDVPARGFGERVRALGSEALDMARVGARFGARSGALFDFSPAGVRSLARQAISGAMGPAALFRYHAAARPDVLALCDDRMRLTYAELDRRIDRLATRLVRKHGVKRGQSAIAVLHNRPEFVEVQAALARIGARAVSASWRSTPAELAYLVQHSNARVLFIESELAGVYADHQDVFPTLPRQNVLAVGGTHPGLHAYDDVIESGPIERLDADSEDAAVVIYTSGTTGKPKGAVRKFGREGYLAYIQLLDELPVRVGDRHLAVCPLYHSTAFAFATITTMLGGTVFVERKFDPETALRRIAEERIATTAMVPTMLNRILALPEATRRRYDLRSLKAIFTAGAPLSGALARETIAELGHVLFNIYGSTETGLNTLATPDELIRSPGTIGHCVGGNEIRLLDDDGRPVARGATGELFVKNTLLVSYHGDDDATRRSMRDGFFSVGDLAHQDESGLFHIDGRKRDMIISGGINVYPAEVEETLHLHPAVAEAAVVGVEDRDLGERVRAFVSLREGQRVEPADIVRFCRERLSGAKVPKEVRILAELPKNPTGKILKRELRELA
jgi:acyl-CoA synthetase (AMP-forming)/AMP-acid ligase II